jgi:phage FluMu protein gp41
MSTVTVTGILKHGIKIGDTVHREFVVRDLSVEDMVESEKEASAHQVHAFNVQQLCRALVQIGDFKGPFVPTHIHRLKKGDYFKLLGAMNEADEMGEGEQDSTASS